MSHISGENTPNTLQMYSERPDWADVTPIPQYEGVNPIAPIFYSPEYKDATGYFRAVVKSGEMSQRVLDLTEDIILKNPAHYSAWQYRYRTVLALQVSLEKELRLMDSIATQFMKTYQVWHHRRLLLTLLTSTSTSSTQPSSSNPIDIALAELEFIAGVLKLDTKNYHTWSYRQWILAHLDNPVLWVGEIPYVDDMLEEDVRNNSAWHHRFFVVFGRGAAARSNASAEEEADVLRREIQYTKDKISLAPNNPSAWFYLRGILDHTNTPFISLLSFVEPYTKPRQARIIDTDEVLDLDNPKPSADAVIPCVPGLDFLAEAYVRDGGENVGKAVSLWKSLADRFDVIRKKYWEYRIKEALENTST